MEKNPRQFWISKPYNRAQGHGITLSNKFHQIADKRVCIVSSYISKPLLIDGLKFDLRIYVAVTSVLPLKIYVYEEGLTRFATQPYSPPESQMTTDGRFTHLTNYSINKLNKDQNQQTKWSFEQLRNVLRNNKIDDKAIFHKIHDIIIKTFISNNSNMVQAHTQFVPSRNNCFQLFGFDVLIDENLQPWLMEVNLSPSLKCDSLLDHKIKSHLIADLLTLVDMGTRPQGQAYRDETENMILAKTYGK